MEMKAISGEFEEIQNDTIDIQKVRFEREMTEVLLNFREECVDLSQQMINFGQPLDESGGFQNPTPDLSAVATIQSDVSIEKVSVPQNIIMADISVDILTQPEQEYPKFELPEVVIPQSVVIEHKMSSNRLSESAQKAIDFVLSKQIDVINIEQNMEETEIYQSEFFETLNFELPQIKYEAQAVDIVQCDVPSVNIKNLGIKELTSRYKAADVLSRICVIDPTAEALNIDISKKTEALKTKLEEKAKGITNKIESVKDVAIPNVIINKTQVQTKNITIPSRYIHRDFEFELKLTEQQWSELRIPSLPTVD